MKEEFDQWFQQLLLTAATTDVPSGHPLASCLGRDVFRDCKKHLFESYKKIMMGGEVDSEYYEAEEDVESDAEFFHMPVVEIMWGKEDGEESDTKILLSTSD